MELPPAPDTAVRNMPPAIDAALRETEQNIMPPAPPGKQFSSYIGSKEAEVHPALRGEPANAGGEQKDIEKVYAFRDAILQGARSKGVETKAELLELFLSAASDHDSEPQTPGGAVPMLRFEALLLSLGIDPTEPSVVWITSHFQLLDNRLTASETEQTGNDEAAVEKVTAYTDVLGLLNYLQLTPEAEEQSILANLNERLCQGADRIGIKTKEELCVFLTARTECMTSDGSAIDCEKLNEQAKLLVSFVHDGIGNDEGKWEFVSKDEFWKTLAFIDPELDLGSGAIVELIERVYCINNGKINTIHLLHDLRLWPGVLEQEHWNALAETMRNRLCDCAQQKGITTKEALCALFADEDGHPKKMSIEEFATLCQEALEFNIDDAAATNSDDGNDDDQDSEPKLISFMRCFVNEDDNCIDVGELLWKLLLWPGSEEEHRALIAGRALRDDLIATAERKGLETAGDLLTSLIDSCHKMKRNDRRDVDPAVLATRLPLPRLLHVLKTEFGVLETPDLHMYLSHFEASSELSPSEDEVTNEDVETPVKLIDMIKLLGHLELYHRDAEADEDEDEETDENEDDYDDDDDETIG